MAQGSLRHKEARASTGAPVPKLVSAVSVWVTLSSCEATPPHLQQRNVAIGRRLTTSGEGMENNQQPTSTTTQYLWEELQLHNVVVGRRFTRSGEDMENAQQLRSTTTVYLWQQVSCQTRYITSRLGWHTVAGSATQQSREDRACTQQAIP